MVPDGKDIVSIHAFGKHRAFLTSDNCVYFFGIDFALNILNSYTKILQFDGNIQSYVFGNGHALLLDGIITLNVIR